MEKELEQDCREETPKELKEPGSEVLSQSPPTEEHKPLTSMVIRGKNIFSPSLIEHDLISHASGNQASDEVHQLIFKPHAARQLQRYIDWGKSTNRNTTEQYGLLLGSLYKTPSGYVGVVEAVLLSNAVANQVFVDCYHSKWAEMDIQLDTMNQKRKRKLFKLGWWHTHPNMRIFMSTVDKDTQRLHFEKDWQFAAVFNPQDKKWGVFIGKYAKPCMGFFLNNDFFELNPIRSHRNKKRKR